MSEPNLPKNTALIPEPSEKQLNELQKEDYRQHRKELIEWIYNFGKDPEQAKGYAETTARERSSRIDKFYRWLWERKSGYTTSVSNEDADEYILYIAKKDWNNTYKDSLLKAVTTLLKYRNWRQDKTTQVDWDPPVTFQNGLQTDQPRNYFTPEELRALCEASLELGSIPHYNSLTPEERDEWKKYLSQRLGKKKSEIGPKDFEEANSWKLPSMVYTSVDAGFRPIEVAKAKISWVDLSNQRLLIPKQDSAKNRENWTVSLREATCRMLSNWLDERQNRSKYDNREELWLTKYGNSYGTGSLNKNVLPKLCEEAGITRDVTWYAIRHGQGTLMSQEKGLKAAQFQLRHKDPKTTQQYDQAPESERRKGLESGLGG